MLGPCFLTLRTLLPVEHETIQNHVQGKSAFKGLLLPTIGGHSSLFQRTDSCLGPELHRHHEMDLQLWKHWQRNCAQVVGLWIRVPVWIQDSLHLKKLQSPVITSDTPIMVYIYMRVLHYITLHYITLHYITLRHPCIHASSQPAIHTYLPLLTYIPHKHIHSKVCVTVWQKAVYKLHLLSSLYISNQHTVYESNVWSPRSSLILSSARVLRPLQPPSLRQRFWRSLKVQKLETVCLVNHEIYLAGSVYSVYKKLYTHTMYYVYFSWRQGTDRMANV